MIDTNSNSQCPVCHGGQKLPGTTTFTVDLGFGVVVVRGVPAQVCDLCGTDWIDDPTAETLEQIERSEALGYDSIWVSEHHFTEDGYLPSGLLFLAAVAARTRRVRLGTLVLLLPLHHPLRVAEDAAVLDLISGGRVDLGVAAGYRAEELRAFGVAAKERGKRMEESLSILQSAWRQEAFSFEGEYFQLEDVNVTPKPLQQPFPLYMGGGSKAAMRRAARFGCHLLPPPSKELIEAYHQELEKHGRSPKNYRIKCCKNVKDTHHRILDLIGRGTIQDIITDIGHQSHNFKTFLFFLLSEGQPIVKFNGIIDRSKNSTVGTIPSTGAQGRNDLHWTR